jgi:hypothetical protein
MSEMGYYELLPDVQYGTPNPATDSDPIKRAELQEKYAQMQFELTTVPGYVPPSYAHQAGGALAKVGWTAQNGVNTPVFPEYTPTGHIPDWTGDPNSISAGRYDQNPVWSEIARNELNRAPIGGAWNDGYSSSEDQNPNSAPFSTDSNLGIDFEY